MTKPTIAFVAAFLALLDPPTALALPGRSLAQHCVTMGTCDVLYCPTAIKFVYRQSGCVVLSKSPAWDINFYNPHELTCFHCMRSEEFAEQLFRSAGLFYKSKFTQLQRVREKPAELLGMPATLVEYHSTAKFEDSARKNMRGEILASATLYWLGKDSRLAPKAAAILANLYQLPVENGLPLRFEWLNAKGETHQWVSTLVLKSVDCPASTFQLPKGLRPVKKASEVVVSEGEIKSLIDELKGSDLK